MPSMKQLSGADMSGWTPVDSSQSGPQPPSIWSDSNPINNPNRSPFMRASMPLAATTNDALGRQYYNGAPVPLYRVLPSRRGSDA